MKDDEVRTMMDYNSSVYGLAYQISHRGKFPQFHLNFQVGDHPLPNHPLKV